MAVVGIRDMRNPYNNLVRKFEGNRLKENNIETEPKKSVDFVMVATDRV